MVWLDLEILEPCHPKSSLQKQQGFRYLIGFGLTFFFSSLHLNESCQYLKIHIPPVIEYPLFLEIYYGSNPHFPPLLKIKIHFVHFYRPRSEGDNVLGSVRPSVRPSVCLFVCLCVLQSVCLCACNQWAYADNRADAVDRLLIKFMITLKHTLSPLTYDPRSSLRYNKVNI